MHGWALGSWVAASEIASGQLDSVELQGYRARIWRLGAVKPAFRKVGRPRGPEVASGEAYLTSWGFRKPYGPDAHFPEGRLGPVYE